MALCMSRRKPPKRVSSFKVRIGVTLVIEAAMIPLREAVKKEVGKMGWKLLQELDGPSLRLRYEVPITVEK
jgi:hypothetical protein